MRKILSAIIIVASLALAGCAATNGAGTSSAGYGVAGLDAAEIAKQMAGVSTALANLPQAPGDAATQQQIANYAAWGAYLTGVAAAVSGAVSGS